ncbi:hypothetical protein LLEC1_02432 [Akanthomyces lecanii]|uniref:Adenosine deaminase domain-containing protein n=1 Tax=Cordyceps confragosa TaxID=2714763 RepID=A0A179IU06_CORDF|nr:hypothetical protein LLEC1_02432 [Akanthomyces lecanii]
MSILPGQLTQAARLALRDALGADQTSLMHRIPKVELHVHVEGTMTPELRWRLAQRRGVKARFGHDKIKIDTLQDLQIAYDNVISSAQLRAGMPSEHLVTFFQAYYSGFEFLTTRQDFYDLAMDWFRRAAAMNVRYCEPFFDPQGHTSRGVTWEDMMGGFRDAQRTAASELNIQSKWIMCFLRDQPPEDAMKHYKAALEYRDMIVGIGLDSNERDRPPCLFEEVFALARRDGFKLTAHCDVGVKDTHTHIHQVASTMAGGHGLDRMDHGLNVADRTDLTALVAQRDMPMTICPWAYLRRETHDSIAERIRVLVDAGIRVSIASDSPAYTDQSWITHNLLLTQRMCGFTDGDMVKLVKNGVDASWAEPSVKTAITQEIDAMLDF